MYSKQCIKSILLIAAMVVIGLMVNPTALWADYIVEPSAYWKLEEAAAQYVDAIGSNDGDCTNCPTQNNADATVGNGQVFDGTNDTIDIAASGNTPADGIFDWGATDSFAIEFWMRRSSGDALNPVEVMIGRDEKDLITAIGLHWWIGLWGLDPDKGKIHFQLKDTGGDGALIKSDYAITDDVWHHIVVVRDARGDQDGQNLMYVDGALQQDIATLEYDAGFDSEGKPVNFGYLDHQDTAEYRYKGELDEVALYRVALAPGIIQQHYSQTTNRGYCNMRPDITSNAGLSATENVTYTYNPMATDAEGDTLTWLLENAPTGMTITASTGAIAWTPDEITSSGPVILVVSDGKGGTDIESFTINVIGVNDAPVITSTAPTTATENAAYIYNPTATDAEGDILTWSFTNAPTGMTIVAATGAISWTPGQGVTTSGTVVLTVSDGLATDTENITIAVTSANSAPEINSTAPTTATENTAYTYNPTATDAEGDILTWSFTNAPTGMTIVAATGAISWTPGQGVSTSGTVTLTVSDGNNGESTEEFTITVSAQAAAAEGSGGSGGSSCFINTIGF